MIDFNPMNDAGSSLGLHRRHRIDGGQCPSLKAWLKSHGKSPCLRAGFR